MVYVQYYERMGVDAIGDRSVIILDGRWRQSILEKIANEHCAKRGYMGWRLFKGESFTRSLPMTDYHQYRSV